MLLEAVRTKNEELAQTWKKSEQWATIEQLCSKKGGRLGRGPLGQGWAEPAGGCAVLLSSHCGGCCRVGWEESCSLIPSSPRCTSWDLALGLHCGISSAQLWDAEICYHLGASTGCQPWGRGQHFSREVLAWVGMGNLLWV